MIKDLQAGDPASVGPYRLLGRLGAGGMGQVYLGKSPGGRLVAIKLIRPELAEERGFRARFASEISAAQNVSGIYTAAVVDADAENELPWMATVYVPGPSLTDAVEENGPLPVTSVVALAGGLAEALAAIHRVGLVHRDLKPSNVLLAADGPRVIDFGISLALERSMMTATGMVMGSPGFMSPEQARGRREVGAPTDVFSLGAVLAYAAAGSNPFGSGPTPALLYRVVNEVPDLTGVPASLSPLIERCLAKDPADRPTPAEILELLGDDVAVLTDEWLPASITQTMKRYTPTLQTPLPPALREPGQTAAEPNPGGTATPVPKSPALGSPVPAGYEPTALAPSIPAAAAAAPAAAAALAASAAVPATVAEHGLFADTSLVSMPSATTTAGRGIAAGGGSGAPPRPGPPPPRRRWRWAVLAAAAAVVVAVVAVLLTSHSHGGAPAVNPTASLAGHATTAPATQASSAAPSPTRTPTTQPASNPATQAAPTTAPARTASPTTSATTATSTPTQTSTTTPTATSTTTSTPTQSATPTQSSAPSGTPTANSSPTSPASAAGPSATP